MTTPAPTTSALILRAAGTNCDAELARALALAGAATTPVHLDRLEHNPELIDTAGIIAFPGGFSFGDDVASGRIFAMRVRLALAERLRAAIDRGACVIGVCNGFQILAQAGLLPGDGTRSAALANNAENRFTDRWVPVQPNPDSSCVWTRGLGDMGGTHTAILPIANGEGRFVASKATLEHIERNNLVALRYAEPVNGSANRIAGITDTTGRVLGLMPHPERYTDWNRHPFWTRLPEAARSATPPGLKLFQNAVAAAAEAGLTHAPAG